MANELVQTNDETDPKITSLARFTPQQQKEIKQNIDKRSSTNARDLEIRRRNLAVMAMNLECMLLKLRDPKTTPEERATINVESGVWGMLGIVSGLEYISDCICQREVGQTKTGKKAYARSTIAEMVRFAVAALGADDASEDQEEYISILGSNDMALEMLNDIGVALNAFKDEHGAIQKDKYMKDMEPSKQKGAKQFEENEAATDAEVEQRTTSDLLEDMKKRQEKK